MIAFVNTAAQRRVQLFTALVSGALKKKRVSKTDCGNYFFVMSQGAMRPLID